VEASGSESRITYNAQITFAGAARLAGPLMQRVFERLGDQVVIRMTAALRRHASSAAGG
jgi:hypothetical protein